MPEYIDREAVITMLETECSPRVMAYLVDQLNAIPAADVKPVVRGAWKVYNNTYVCSACGRPVSFWKSDFCPNCGAKMEES